MSLKQIQPIFASKSTTTRANTIVNKKVSGRYISRAKTATRPKYVSAYKGKKSSKENEKLTHTPVLWTQKYLEDERVLHQVQPRKSLSPLQPGEIEDIILLHSPTAGFPAVSFEMDGINRLANDDIPAALKAYIRAAWLEQDNAYLLLKVAYLQLLLGEPDKALEYCTEAMSLEEEHLAPAALMKCSIYLFKGQTVQALTAISSTASTILSRIQFLKKLSNQANKSEDDWELDISLEEAMESISQQVTQHEAYLVTAMSLEGEAYSRLSCSKRAERSFRAALALKDSHTSSLLGLARAQFYSGETSGSCEQYEKVIEQESENVLTADDWARYSFLCSLHRSECETVNACTIGLEAAKSDTKHAFLYLLRAEAIMKNFLKPSDLPMGVTGMSNIMHKSVMKDINSAIKFNPQLRVAYGLAASCHAETGQYETAIMFLDKIIDKKRQGGKPDAKIPNWQAQAIATRANILFRLYQSTRGSLKPQASNISQESVEFLQTITNSLPSNIRNYKSLVAKSPLYRAMEDCRSISSAQMQSCRGMFGNIVSCVVQDQKKKHKNSLDKLPLRAKDGSILYM